MKRFLALLSVALMAAACAGATPAPSPTPLPTTPGATPFVSPSPPPGKPSSRPSPACGGFHLLVVNETGSEIAVSINGAQVTTVPPTELVRIVQAGQATTSTGFGRVEIIEMFWGLPSLPWDVTISRTEDNLVWLTQKFTVDDGEGARIDVTGPAPGIAFGSCGSLG